jgi:predicted short-subunit dehydrogenase-like oxidoreductase (DUF2520 family)
MVMNGLPDPVAIVGGGRLGVVMAEALRDAGVPLAGVVVRSDASRARCLARGLPICADLTAAATIVLCVPDDLVAATAAALPHTARVVLHTSGCVGIDALAGAGAPDAVLGSVHPLMTIAANDQGSCLAGAHMAVTAADAQSGAAARALVSAVGGIPFSLDDSSKPLYHAAASLAANATVALLDGAIASAVAAGMTGDAAREALTTLAAAAVTRVRKLGPGDALTGPVARGDANTVRMHRSVLAARAPSLLPLYDASARAALALAVRNGLADDAVASLRRALDEGAVE